MEAALSGEQPDNRRKAKPIPGSIDEPSTHGRRSPLNPFGLRDLAARFVADLGRTPRYDLRSAPAGSAKSQQRSPMGIPK